MRRFRRHDKRSVTELNGFWDFAFLGDVDLDSIDVGKIDFVDRMAVPGCFDSTPDYAGWRGLTAYRTHVLLPDSALHRLVFDGVNHWCRVYVDDQKMCDHVGGHTRFSVDIADHQPGETAIIVLVDNRFDYERCPLHLDHMDWYHHGGIARPVELHQLGELWINSLVVTTEDWQERRIAVTVSYGSVSGPCEIDFILTFNGEEILKEKVELVEGQGEIRRVLELPGANLWSPETPNLHLIHVCLGEDDIRERIGIRQMKVEGRRIMINGEPIILRGLCRHELHPDFGCGLPDAQIVADAQILRKIGCNVVRGVHYPQDPRFLDLCDEMGICVLSESIGWQNTEEQINDPHFIKAQLNNIDEMVAVSINHPSVITWGILNEGDSAKEGSRKGYETLLGRLRELDASRPVTYSTCHPEDDKCLDLCDIVSLNWFPGWYLREIDEIPEELDRIVGVLDSVGCANKPILISEIAAGAVAGFRDWYQDRWTEDYQAKLLGVALRHLLFDRDRVCGVCIWQFADCRSFERIRGILTRPRGYNSKGVVDEYRRPKLAFDVVKRLYQELGRATSREAEG
ncbi:glycoside hydrolase family 2 protein [Candidatus Hydrogenedentota bacterium]